MTQKKISEGTVHELPADLRKALLADKEALEKWEDITPLARNDWICWTISVKQPETRREHVERLVSELKEGKRRPCCWIGCIHRTDKAISPSVKYILSQNGGCDRTSTHPTFPVPHVISLGGQNVPIDMV